MKILLDTHIVIWAMSGSPKLSRHARDILDDVDNEFFFSAASLWEVALKHRRSPDKIPVSSEQIERFCRENEISPLPVRFGHARAVEDLPPIHGDSFDRMLVAQANAEGIVLLTHDDDVAAYGASVVKV